VDGDGVRLRAYAISQGPGSGTEPDNWLRAERELAVDDGYDTAERDLERLGMTLSRLPTEAGVTWRLSLPRGEQVEAWEPGNAGLSPPDDVMRLIGGVVAGKELVPGPPASADHGAARLRALLEEQRVALLTHDPGTRLGADPENLHQHRVAARRARAFLHVARAAVDPSWRRSLDAALRELGEATGPVRDLDVLLGHLHRELGRLDEADREGAATLLGWLERDRELAGRRLSEALDGDGYRVALARLRLPPRLAEGVETVPLDRIARKELRRLAKAVARLGRQPAEEQIHRLRIRLKRARYAAELAAPPGAALGRFVADARMLQDLLGEHQDAVVAERHLRAATVHDGQTATAFAAGRLAERQRARRARVREGLPAAWKRLRKSGARLA
jgi:CHAD domain-containing protein